jgi:hypothetical protein
MTALETSQRTGMSTRGTTALVPARAVDGYLGKMAEVEWTEVVGSLRVQ